MDVVHKDTLILSPAVTLKEPCLHRLPLWVGKMLLGQLETEKLTGVATREVQLGTGQPVLRGAS